MISKHFEKFLQSDYIDKIVDMFIYISENVNPFPPTIVNETYADCESYFLHSSLGLSDPYDEEDEETIETKDKCELLKYYLDKISHRILNSERFFKECTFLFKFN